MPNTERTSNQTRCRTPATNFVELENDYGLEIEMPGVDRANIEINVQGRELEIVAEKTVPPNEWRPIARETSHCVYRRTFTLGDEIDRDAIKARYESGVLYLTLPKSKAVLPRKIEIT
jgi:HSP20 family protein